MKQDLYIKVVLTVIAALLFLNLLKMDGFVTTAHGATAATDYLHVPLNNDGSINVRIVDESATQDVVIVGWRSGRLSGDKIVLSPMPHYLPQPEYTGAAFPMRQVNR